MFFDLSLYLVTDRKLSLHRDIEWIVTEAVKGGVTMVQLREKDCSTREFINLAFSLKQRLKTLQIPLIINDRIDVVLAVDADGVHIGQSDMPYEIARQLIGPDKIIGLSVESMDQVKLSNLLDVDYIGISPVFGTSTKTDTNVPFGLAGTAEAVKLSRHPVVGIGGINERNVAEVIRTGINGVAVVSAICSAPNPADAAKYLKSLIFK